MKLFTLWVLFLNPQGIVERSERVEEFYGTFGKHLCVKRVAEVEQFLTLKGTDAKVECRENNVDYKTIDWDDVYIKS